MHSERDDLPWVIVNRSSAETVWNSSRVGWVMFGGLVLCCAYWWRRSPAPGYAGLLLGFAAALIASRELKWHEKFAWTLLLFAFLPIEFKAIHADRAKQNADFRAFRASEQQHFEATANDIKKELQTSKDQFDATAKHIDATVALVQKVAGTLSQHGPCTCTTQVNMFFRRVPSQSSPILMIRAIRSQQIWFVLLQ